MKCKYCKKTIYPWQSYFKMPARIPEDNNIILFIPDYARYTHEGCHFFRNNKREVLPENTEFEGYEWVIGWFKTGPEIS